jgi:hypothetical protein
MVYAFEPSRPSLRFVMGHPSQVHTPGTPQDLSQLLRYNGGFILAQKNTTIPANLPCKPSREQEDGRWVVYRCEPSDE